MLIYSQEKLDERAAKVIEEFGLLQVEASDEQLAHCDLVMGWPSRINSGLIAKMPTLRYVQSLSAGVDSLDFRSLPPGVLVYSNAGGYTGPVAEQAWALGLAMAKGVNQKKERVVPRPLRGRTLLVLGAGGIGCEVARIAKASLGMRTVGLSRSFSVPEVFDERRPISDLKSVIGEADLMVDALPSTAFTKGLLDYETLKRAKETVVLVNVGRGDTIDESAILRILRERPETRFGTDVFWRGETRESFETPLWELPNFGGTLHTGGGGGGEEGFVQAQVAAAENVRLVLTTGKGRNLVPPEEYVGGG